MALTSPIPPPESTKTVLLNKDWTIEVDTSPTYAGQFVKLFGIRSLEGPLDSESVDVSTYDDGIWKAEMPSDMSWALNVTLLLALYKQGAALVEDPALVVLRNAHQQQKLVHVRWYRRNADISEGFEGYGYVKVSENGGPKSQPSEATANITGSGERFVINNPYNAAPPVAAAWAATTDYAYGDLVTVAGGTLRATEDGTSGAVAPTAPATVGGTVIDGTVEWTRTA